jgi:hypothetical protein
MLRVFVAFGENPRRVDLESGGMSHSHETEYRDVFAAIVLTKPEIRIPLSTKRYVPIEQAELVTISQTK